MASSQSVQVTQISGAAQVQQRRPPGGTAPTTGNAGRVTQA